ncbi:ABC transporter ATP-binding protein [Cuniculiplasma divulgatum]|jgi:multiple sugar transport system ATP-binding protein|uniref:CUT1 family ABC transporter ATPase n=1 Tax=Cuniculiplasma divulgatum TaxID=1673428 RepID=A0A1R4A7Y0_9ARCH|nr:ABC transporter ATP-binding protein [Cuniculiplasma divulgatum]WMT49377.1 MAG: ABC transporter ATP-binding protein [Thermoplasmatales archaeon]SJK85049.1 CUT1 family ABC transporter ATPase [Cuniculiplasma divulgatum]
MAIELKKLNMAYGSTVALKDFDLHIEDGEFVAILGPSGGGKSTILRIIAGLIIQDSGDVVINGEIMNDIHPSERNVAMVFQNQALYPHMTVYNNLALNLRMKGVSKDEIDRRVNEVAKIVGINTILSRKPREISGGQAQRVGLARAMIRDPVIYLMDEPLTGLDAKFRDEMREELIHFHRITKKSILYVTHDQIEAMSMADRIVVLNNGVKIQEGAPRELYDNPEHVFVATFVGSPAMNTFNFVKNSSNPHMFILDSEDETTPFGLEFESADLPDKLTIGIRPTDFKLVVDGEIKTTLKTLEFLGSVIQIKVEMGSSDITIALSRESRTKTDIFDLKPGSELRFSVDSERFYVFGPDGSRIKNPIVKIHPPEKLVENKKGK